MSYKPVFCPALILSVKNEQYPIQVNAQSPSPSCNHFPLSASNIVNAVDFKYFRAIFLDGAIIVLCSAIYRISAL